MIDDTNNRAAKAMRHLGECCFDIISLKPRWTDCEAESGSPVFTAYYHKSKTIEHFMLVWNEDGSKLLMVSSINHEYKDLDLATVEELYDVLEIEGGSSTNIAIGLEISETAELPDRIDVHPMTIAGLLASTDYSTQTLLSFNSYATLGYEGYAMNLGCNQTTTPSLMLCDLTYAESNFESWIENKDIEKVRFYASVAEDSDNERPRRKLLSIFNNYPIVNFVEYVRESEITGDFHTFLEDFHKYVLRIRGDGTTRNVMNAPLNWFNLVSNENQPIEVAAIQPLAVEDLKLKSTTPTKSH